ncbi:ABC transporter permease [Gordonia sp. DT30]|uniref:ABC transporter permease n=1 Tax=Gordonia sp. DT30 TaxID=3416546 RepID=UPI003CE746D2
MTRPTKLPSLGFNRFSGLYLWAIFIITFAIWVPDLFLTTVTLHTVADSQAVAAMLGIAIAIPLAAGTFDLSVGAVVGFSAIVVTALQSNHGWGVWSSIAVAVGLSLVIGALNGLVVVVFKVNSFIATLGSSSIVGAFIVIAAGESQPLPPVSETWNNLTQVQFAGGFQIIVLYLLVLALIVWWVLAKTPVGRYLYAIGGNPEAARLSGVNVGGWTWMSLIASAGISGAAGVLYASQNGPSLTFGPALLLPAFSAAFLGSTQFTPGRVNIWGTLLAVYVLATGVKGLQLVTGVQWLPAMFNGVALIAAVAFAGWAARKTIRRERPESDAAHPNTLHPDPDDSLREREPSTTAAAKQP